MKKITKKIIRDAQYGDLDALDFILDEFSKFAYYQAIKALKDHDLAQDCVQSALNYFVKNFYKYNDDNSHFYGWGHSIIDSAIKTTIRNNNRYKARFIFDEEVVINTNDTNNTSGELKCILSDLEKHIGEEKYQLILYRLGYNYQFTELAEIFNCSLRTIKRKYSEAMKEAKKYFGEK